MASVEENWHTSGDSDIATTKAYEQRLSSVHQCVNYAQRYPWNAYLLHLYVYLHAYLIPLDVLCSQTMRQPKLFFVCIYYCH